MKLKKILYDNFSLPTMHYSGLLKSPIEKADAAGDQGYLRPAVDTGSPKTPGEHTRTSAAGPLSSVSPISILSLQSEKKRALTILTNCL